MRPQTQSKLYMLELPGGATERERTAAVLEADNALAIAISDKVKDLVQHCPDPTRRDLHRLIALQGHCLQAFGLKYLSMSETTRPENKKFYIEFGMKLMRHSSEQFKTLLDDPRFDPKLLENEKAPAE